MSKPDERLPLTEPWIEDFRSRVEPRLTESQRIVLKRVWDWAAEYWANPDGEDRPKKNHPELAERVLPHFEALESAETSEQIDRALATLNSVFDEIGTGEYA